MSKKIIIVSGGKLEEEVVLPILNQDEYAYMIAVDRGMEFLYKHKIAPSYIVGDFDSVDPKVADYFRHETSIPIREFHPEKDASDTEIAIRLAMTLGCDEILILGATGGRLDHMWANVQSLSIPFKAGIDARIIDRQNCIRLIGNGTVLKRSEAFGTYFSLFPLGQEIFGLTIEGAKYPLNKHSLNAYDSRCVSNEFEEEEVRIDFLEGIIVLMETKDL